MRRLAVVMVLACVGACSASLPLYSPRLTGGAVDDGWRAQRLVERAGVRWLFRLDQPAGTTNAVEIGAGLFLTAEHVFPADAMKLQLDGGVRHGRALLRGDAEGDANRWVVFEASDRDPWPCQLEASLHVAPGEQIAVAGYWSPATGGAGVKPVAVRGQLLDPPPGLPPRADRLLFIDHGPRPAPLDGLSGSAVLARTSEGEPWRLVGVFAGQARLDNGIVVSVAIPIAPQALERFERGQERLR